MPSILVIDDDDLSREVLVMLLEVEGYAVSSAVSGDAALANLVDADVILTDMQMPGLCGNPLAVRLREAYPATTRLIAMSGSEVSPSERTGYDGFLLKPFDVVDLEALLSSGLARVENAATQVLDEATYANLHRAMTPKQVAEMFEFCLTDAEKRLARMAEAETTGDDVLYRREAHTIKGGCGMLGALELRELAGVMETEGLVDGNKTTELRDRFLDAAARLRRILEVDTRT